MHGADVTDTPQGRERATTILVAEDDDALRGIVTRVFWDQGFRTLEARHGGEALHLAELAAPYLDLVVTDVIMPEVDGLELGRRVAHGELPAAEAVHQLLADAFTDAKSR